MGNPIGNFLVSVGCLLMLIPVIGLLLFLLVAVVSALFGG